MHPHPTVRLLRHSLLLATLLAPSLAFVARAATAQEDVAAQEAVAVTLSDAEVRDGWVLLFDGTSTSAWRGFKKPEFPHKGWVVRDGALCCEKGGGGGDLATRRQFANFDLRFSWRVAPGANSGVIYRSSEDEGASYITGPEYQVLDDGGHGDGKNPRTSAASLYALYAPEGKHPNPVGEWNRARIVVDGNRIEHWLDDVKVVEATIGSDDWNERIAASKFASWQRFAKMPRGHICLQDHGDDVAYRDIKIRELPPAADRLGEEIVLFDGKSLDKWSAHLSDDTKQKDVWSITDDGVLVCKGKPQGYIYTDDEFDNFVLRLQWRFDPAKGAGNSGVLLRMTGEHKVWPRSIEAQLHSGNAGDFWNIGDIPMQVDATRTRGRNTKKTHGNEKPLGEWNQYEIIADGGWVSLRINGEVLNEAWDCQEIPGKICLQSEGAEIHFRDIRLTPLK